MRIRRLGSIGASIAIMLSLAGTATPARAIVMCADETMQGCWSAPFSPNGEFDERAPKTPQESTKYPSAASIVVLPNGRMVYWNGLQNLENAQYPLPADAGRVARNSESKMLDLGGDTPLFVNVATNDGDDMFCADQRLLATGQVMVAGGTRWVSDPDTSGLAPGAPGGAAELYGSNNTHFFTDGAWDPVNTFMNRGRWYPAMLTLANGNMAVFGGVEKLLYNTKGFNVNEVEIFDRTSGRWAARGESQDSTLPLFPRMHLLPNGEVLYTGAGQMWGPFGQAADEALWNLQKTYNPATNSWNMLGLPSYGARSGAFSTLLPLRPNASGEYPEARILVGGGVLGTSPGAEVGTKFTEILTARDGNGDGKAEVTSQAGPELNNFRWYSSAVVLPNGEVLVANGADKDEVVQPGIETPVKQLEIFTGGAFKPVAKLANRNRTYHNSLILLADGSVLIGGHAPINKGYGPGTNGAEVDALADTVTTNLKDPSFERYFPPYLFNGTRPQIKTAQAGASWGSDLVATLEPGSAPVAKVVLTRTPSTTHTTDADARTVEVSFTQTGDSLHVNVPDDGDVLPPGYYYLFALNADGTPAVAPIVKIAAQSDLGGAAGAQVAPVTLGTPANVR